MAVSKSERSPSAPVEITAESVEAGERLHPVVKDMFDQFEAQDGKTGIGVHLYEQARKKDGTAFAGEKVLTQELANSLWPVDKLDPSIAQEARTVLQQTYEVSNGSKRSVGLDGIKNENDSVTDEESIETAKTMVMKLFLENSVASGTYPTRAADALKILAQGAVVVERDNGSGSGDYKQIRVSDPGEAWGVKRIVADQDQFKATDEQIVDAFNTFKAFFELQGKKVDIKTLFDPMEFKKIFPNLRQEPDGTTYKGSENNADRKTNLADAQRDYVMVKEKMATMLQKELGSNEPLTENQLRDRLKNVESENRELQRSLEATTESKDKEIKSQKEAGENASRRADIAELKLKQGTEGSAGEIAAEQRKTAEFKTGVSDKLAEIQALLASAGFGNRAKVMESAEAQIAELLKSLK